MRAIRVAALVFGAVMAAHAGLLHRYTFDDFANDSFGTANGTLFGATVSGGYLHLNGLTDWVQFDEHIVPIAGNFSVLVRFNANILQNGFYQELISQGLSSEGAFLRGPGYFIGRGPDAGVSGSPIDTFRAGDDWQTTGLPFPLDGQWHTVILVVDTIEPSSKLYLDGFLAASVGHALATTSGGDNTRFGKQFEAFGEFFSGELDEVQIYNNALTPAEIAVPEPGTISIAALGSVALLVLARRRKNEISS